MQLHCLTLQVKCRNAGCGARAEVGSYSAHAKECEYENEVCRHTGCKHECTRKEMEAHVDQCPFRKLPCIKNCGLEVTSVDQGKHSCRKELMEKLQGKPVFRFPSVYPHIFLTISCPSFILVQFGIQMLFPKTIVPKREQ